MFNVTVLRLICE